MGPREMHRPGASQVVQQRSHVKRKLWNPLQLFVVVSIFRRSHASSRPPYADPEFDCAMRRLAYSFAKDLIPRQKQFVSVFDALELNTMCNESMSHEEPGMITSKKSITLKSTNLDYVNAKTDVNDKTAIFVDFLHGSDEAAGFKNSPLKTIQQAVLRAREMAHVNTVYLRGSGMHYIDSTIKLNELDSGLTISGYPHDDEIPTVSAAVPLHKLEWVSAPNLGGSNIFAAKISDAYGLDDIPGIHYKNERMVVARYPNTPRPFEMNENFHGDNRISQGTATFLPPRKHRDSNATYVKVNEPSRAEAYDHWFSKYIVGVDGSCCVYEPSVSYWCSNETEGGDVYHFKLPSGIMLSESFLPNLKKYTAVGISQALVNVWRPKRWENWMFEGTLDFDTKKFLFTKGGFQGGRGDSVGGDWFIENVFEELDSPNEFYYSRAEQVLYICVNATEDVAYPDSMGVLAVPKHETIFNITGSSSTSLAQHITISNVKLTGTRHTYMSAPHSPPSGGDWSLERRGAIFLENTSGTTVKNALIDRVDGHGIMISGKNIQTSIIDNEIRWVGGSGIASWGRTDGDDDESGFTAHKQLYPDGNRIVRNLIHEVGHFEKQNSFYMQAKTARSLLLENVFFNGPRAGINFNDGFTGGDIIHRNLVFNACRESGDHGTFNSWDRQPFLTPGSPQGGIGMDWRIISNNFFIANYDSQEAIDTDDGSAYFKVFNNFLVYSTNGLKSNFGGHDIHHFSNLYACVQHCLHTITSQLPHHENHFHNNTCILADSGNYADFLKPGSWPRMGNNQVYVKNTTRKSNVTINDYLIEDFQSKFPGIDDGTKVFETPETGIIVKWAHELLKIGHHSPSIDK